MSAATSAAVPVLHDLRRAAVVAGQRDDGDAREPLLDVEQRRRVGAVPAVDRLAVIADEADVGATVADGVEQRELQRVEVLRLVDEQVAEPPAHDVGERARRAACSSARAPADRRSRRRRGVASTRCTPTTRRRRLSPSSVLRRRALPRGLAEALGLDHPDPGPVEVGHDRGRVAAQPRLGQHLADQAMAIGGDDRGRGVRSSALGRATGAARRRGTCPTRSVAHVQPAQPPAQLAGRVTRERQGQHVLRVGRAVVDAARDASGQDRRLARSGGGDDRQRRRVGRDGEALLGIETTQQPLVLVEPNGCGRRARSRARLRASDPRPLRHDRATVGAMTFAKKNLNPNETVALDMHPHWWYFAGPAVSLVGRHRPRRHPGVGTDISGTGGDVLKVLVIALLVIAALWLIVRYLKWITTYFVITSHRLIFRTGVLGQERHRDPARAHQQRQLPPEHPRAPARRRRPADRVGRRGRPEPVHRHPPSRSRAAPDPRADGEHGPAPRQLRATPTVASSGSPSNSSGSKAMLQRGTLSLEEFEAQKRKLLDT